MQDLAAGVLTKDQHSVSKIATAMESRTPCAEMMGGSWEPFKHLDSALIPGPLEAARQEVQIQCARSLTLSLQPPSAFSHCIPHPSCRMCVRGFLPLPSPSAHSTCSRCQPSSYTDSPTKLNCAQPFPALLFYTAGCHHYPSWNYAMPGCETCPDMAMAETMTQCHGAGTSTAPSLCVSLSSLSLSLSLPLPVIHPSWSLAVVG